MTRHSGLGVRALASLQLWPPLRACGACAACVCGGGGQFLARHDPTDDTAANDDGASTSSRDAADSAPPTAELVWPHTGPCAVSPAHVADEGSPAPTHQVAALAPALCEVFDKCTALTRALVCKGLVEVVARTIPEARVRWRWPLPWRARSINDLTCPYVRVHTDGVGVGTRDVAANA